MVRWKSGTTMNTDRLALPPHGAKILCAVSGGADSMCLLHLLKSLEREKNYTVCAAHFEHGLRGEEALRDQRFVEDFCRERGIPCLSGHGDTRSYASEHGLSIEEAARTLRYDFLERAADALGCDEIATAHHADDNAETVLLHLVRGSGSRGLSGIPPRRGRIIRPLLALTRSEIEDYVCAQGLPYVEDSTNECEEYSRNLLRRRVMPALRRINPAASETIARAAALLRQDEEYLCAQAQAWIEENLTDGSFLQANFNALHGAVAARVLRCLAARSLSAAQIEQALRFACGTERAVLTLPGLYLRRETGRLYLTEETPVPGFAPRRLLPGEQAELPALGLRVTVSTGICPAGREEIHSQFKTYCLKYEKLQSGVWITPRQSGDRLRLPGRGLSKSLKALFLENKMPRAARERTLVFRMGEELAAVYPFSEDERFAARPGEMALILRVERMDKTGENDEE